MTPSKTLSPEMKVTDAIFVKFTEGRYGTHISKWEHKPFDGALEYRLHTRPPIPGTGQESGA